MKFDQIDAFMDVIPIYIHVGSAGSNVGEVNFNWFKGLDLESQTDGMAIYILSETGGAKVAHNLFEGNLWPPGTRQTIYWSAGWNI